MILITILGLVLGWREVQILCEQVKDDQTKTSWKFNDYRNWFWQTDQNDKKKSNWDSFHVLGGIAVYLICLGIDTPLDSIKIIRDLLGSTVSLFAFAIVEWLYIFWIRNIMMHVIMPKKPKWKYLIPLL